ncbi:rab-GTPase-TBC domain-containing protein [Podospora conica]|nr:rab-GTPase-TBC domain-containing protein [Schizothecium conicum]
MEQPVDTSLLEKTASHAGSHSEKEEAILKACQWRDLEALKALAVSSGGFLTDALRQQAWPILLGLPPGYTGTEEKEPDWRDLPRHRDEDQVRLDVDRAFIYYPEIRSEAELTRQKAELSALILEVLRRHPYLHYFQGYHDICQVLLLVLPPPLRAPSVSRLSVLRIRDFMLPTLSPALSQLRLIPDILLAADPQLWRHLSQVEPFFALSGTLTMYAHDITTLGAISRLFDVLLAREPAFSVYLFAAIVRARRAELFATPADEPEMLHSILCKLPRPLDIDALVAEAGRLCDAHPPERLAAWRSGISRNSVLRTARDAEACAAQTMEDGEVFFRRHVAELKWLEKCDKAKELLWQHRYRVRNAGFAVIIGIAALLLRRYPWAWQNAVSLMRRWLS